MSLMRFRIASLNSRRCAIASLKIISCDDFERSFSWRAMHAVSLGHLD
jgi:hypothetical protein